MAGRDVVVADAVEEDLGLLRVRARREPAEHRHLLARRRDVEDTRDGGAVVDEVTGDPVAGATGAGLRARGSPHGESDACLEGEGRGGEPPGGARAFHAPTLGMRDRRSVGPHPSLGSPPCPGAW